MENTWDKIPLARVRNVSKCMILFWSLMFEMSFLHDQTKAYEFEVQGKSLD